jgi:hypothetical protein
MVFGSLKPPQLKKPTKLQKLVVSDLPEGNACLKRYPVSRSPSGIFHPTTEHPMELF